MLQISRRPSPPGIDDRTRARWFFWMMVILTGWLLFAHGCHGDEDTELFTAATRIVFSR